MSLRSTLKSEASNLMCKHSERYRQSIIWRAQPSTRNTKLTILHCKNGPTRTSSCIQEAGPGKHICKSLYVFIYIYILQYRFIESLGSNMKGTRSSMDLECTSQEAFPPTVQSKKNHARMVPWLCPGFAYHSTDPYGSQKGVRSIYMF